MSRSGYSDDCENINLYRGAVDRAIVGKRGQRFFRELVIALDALPEKRLITSAFQARGEVCALGALAKLQAKDLEGIDGSDHDTLGDTFDIASSLAAETMYENDDGNWRDGETPEQRWERVRKWAAGQVRP